MKKLQRRHTDPSQAEATDMSVQNKAGFPLTQWRGVKEDGSTTAWYTKKADAMKKLGVKSSVNLEVENVA